LPAPLEAPAGLVYAGRVAAFRELETISTASRQVDLPITVVGPSDDTWLTSFDRGRLDVRPALPLDGASDLIQAAGLSLVTHSDKWENHRLAMPNKLFHAVSLGVPVVATEVGELARMVRAHNLGTLYTPGDARSMVAAIRDAVEQYPTLVSNVGRARPELSWETDADRLLAIYTQLGEKEQKELP
ncbi:MAG: glycosyltransferase, partial [Arachnia sp.]